MPVNVHALTGFNLVKGGKTDSNNTYSYNMDTNSWEIISHMPTPRHWCLVTIFSDNKLMVVGGETDTGDTKQKWPQFISYTYFLLLLIKTLILFHCNTYTKFYLLMY